MSPASQPPPVAALAAFPAYDLGPDVALFRIHRAQHDVWFFGSSGTSRFDLPAPHGTCYLAEDPVGAFLETFRYINGIPESEVLARRLSEVRVPTRRRIADLTARAARGYGVTAALHSMSDYTLPQQWAWNLFAAGYGGLRYLVSHDPLSRHVGVALFGPAGPAEWPAPAPGAITRPLIDEVEREFGIIVVPNP